MGMRRSGAPEQAQMRDPVKQKSKLTPSSHPAARTHPVSRRNAIYVSEALTSHIEGMDIEEGRSIIKEISDFATQSQFVYRHEWRVGDLLFWDNRSTTHRVLSFDESKYRRVMHRTTVQGDRLFLEARASKCRCSKSTVSSSCAKRLERHASYAQPGISATREANIRLA